MNNIFELKRYVYTMCTQSTPVNNNVASNIKDDEQWNQVAKEVRSIQDKLAKYLFESDREAIKFCGLGFRTYLDAQIWREENCNSQSFGLIVDAHMVLEHVYSSIFSFDVVQGDTEMSNLARINVVDLIDGFALRSFRNRIPRYQDISVGPVRPYFR